MAAASAGMPGREAIDPLDRRSLLQRDEVRSWALRQTAALCGKFGHQSVSFTGFERGQCAASLRVFLSAAQRFLQFGTAWPACGDHCCHRLAPLLRPRRDQQRRRRRHAPPRIRRRSARSGMKVARPPRSHGLQPKGELWKLFPEAPNLHRHLICSSRQAYFPSVSICRAPVAEGRS